MTRIIYIYILLFDETWMIDNIYRYTCSTFLKFSVSIATLSLYFSGKIINALQENANKSKHEKS